MLPCMHLFVYFAWFELMLNIFEIISVAMYSLKAEGPDSSKSE